MRLFFIAVSSFVFLVSCGSSSEGPVGSDIGLSPDVTETDNQPITVDAPTVSDPGEAPLEDVAQSPEDMGSPSPPPSSDEGASPAPPDAISPEDSPTPQDLSPADSGSEFVPCTEPLDWECADDAQLYKCDSESGLLVYEACIEGSICTSSECRPVICTLDEKKCTSQLLYQQCINEGTAWMDDLPCPEGTECDPESDSCMEPPPDCPVEQCMSANLPVDGLCVPEYKEAGASCDDESLETHSDQCTEDHNCAGTSIVCEEKACHEAGVPNGVDCNYEPSPAGGTCDDNSLETAGDTCNGDGLCVGIAITCEEKVCREPGVPNGVDCDYALATTGSSCDDNNVATMNDACTIEGTCAGSPIVCEEIQCMEGAPNGEGCIYSNIESGFACDDDNINTAEDSCDGDGNCVGEPIQCEVLPCVTDAWPNGIDCTFEFAPEGTECDDGMGNTLNDVCDEFGNCYGTPFADICDCTVNTGSSTDALICAMDIGCYPEYVGDVSIYSPTGDNLNNAYKAVNRFGSTSNDLAPHKGDSYTLLATGIATGTFHSKGLPGGSPGTDPFDPTGGSMHDAIELRVELTAPPGAKGFSLEYVFFSVEFDDYVGTSYNDKFYIVMNAPLTTGGFDKVINFTDCRNPGEYFDLSGADCPLESGYCCYIAINTALSECCWYNGCPNGTWTTDIGGTGFECASSSWSDNQYTGSSTGWLTTTWNVEAGETFTLTFHVHDTGDSIWDSEVLLDNFQWAFEEVTPGTGISGLP